MTWAARHRDAPVRTGGDKLGGMRRDFPQAGGARCAPRNPAAALFAALAFTLALGSSPAARADTPVVEAVEAHHPGMDWTFDVTLSHPDTGWDHYADGWEVLDAAGNRLGYRELMHPHVHEQPFTRALRGVMLADGVREVFIRTRCSRDGWAEETVRVSLERLARW